MTHQQPAVVGEGVDRFKEAFKRYKKRNADLSDSVDLCTSSQRDPELIRLQNPVVSTSGDAAQLGLIPTDQWKIYSLASTPGLLVIPNPFTEGWQHYWVRRCLVDYPCLPNVCSLDAHLRREGVGKVWPGGRGKKRELLHKLRWTTLGYHYDWNTKEYCEDHKSPFPPDLSRLSSLILEVAGFPGFLAEAAIVNYYHLDSTLSGHRDHSERDLSHPLLSISFGQSAIFLVGGETKSVRPQAITLHSGDVVIMSGPSRLAYHGVPKILSPSPAAPVPPPLSRLSLLSQLQRRGDPMQQHPCRLQSGPLCGACRTETERELSEHTPAGGVSGSTTEIPPTAKRVRTQAEGDRERAGGESECQLWTDTLREWPDFERYISTSRINVNVRQVNTRHHKYIE